MAAAGCRLAARGAREISEVREAATGKLEGGEKRGMTALYPGITLYSLIPFFLIFSVDLFDYTFSFTIPVWSKDFIMAISSIFLGVI